MTTLTKRFLIVDDDPASNFLSKMILKKILGEVVIKDFVNPELALEYINAKLENEQPEEKTILLLDINMPILTGWEFLEKFETFRETIQNQFNIYMLSSSIDPADIQRAEQNQLVKDFIEKPLKKVVLEKMFS